MQVSEVMTSNPESAQCGDSLRSVAAQMEQGNFGSVPVLEGERLAGVVTDRDIAVRGVAQGLSPDEPIQAVMSAEAICVSPDCDVQEAAQLMQDQQIRRLYVTDNDALVGVVALADLVDGTSERVSGETIEKISQD